MKILNVIYIPFTGVGLIGYRGDDWFNDRISIFKRYTLLSLASQTHKDFILWLSFRPEEKDNPLTIALGEYLERVGFKHVMTFNGLMYWDDKFNNDLYSKIANGVRIIRRCYRLGNWAELIPSLRDLLKDKNSTLEQRIEKSVMEIPANHELVYLTRVDSDDMLARDYLENLRKSKDTPDAFVCKEGLILNTSTGELAEWLPDTNPPFHTIVFSYQTFFDGKRHLARYGSYKSHEDVTKIFPKIVTLPKNSYCVTTHDPKNHISTTWTHPFKGKIVNPGILDSFGI